MKRTLATFLAAMAALLPPVSQAITLRPDGTGDYPSLSAALTALGAGGGEIVMEAGDYPVTATVVVGAPVTIRSASGDWRDVTVYRTGSTKFSVFRLNDAGATLSGITITNGYSSADKQGGAVYTTAAATIQNCRITANAGTCATVNLVNGAKLLRCRIDANISQGGSQHMGIYMEGASALAEDCEVINNDGGSRNYDARASAFRIYGGTVRRCVVTNNFNSLGSYSHDGAIRTDGACLIENCLVAGNTSGYGASFESNAGSGAAAGIHVNAAGCVIRNCTIVDNSGVSFGGVRAGVSTHLRLENSIVWGNCQFINGDTTTAANNSTALADSNISNLPRAYATNVCSTLFFGEGSITNNPVFVDAAHGDYRLAANSPCRNAGYARPGDDAATDLAGNARVFGGAIDIGCYEGTAAEPSVALPDIRQDVFLTAGGDLAEALTQCGDGSTLHVGPGDYPVSKTLLIDKAVRIVSDEGPDRTFLHRVGPYGGGERFRIAVSQHPDAVISGFTFSNAYVEVGFGGAIGLRAGTVTNCVVTKCYSLPHSYGGGLIYTSGGRIRDCIFKDNYGSGGSGGVATLIRGGEMTGCDILRNNNPNSNAGQAQVIAYADSVVRRCRFIGNVACGGGSAGALHLNGGNCLVENCLFFGNTNGWSTSAGGGITIGVDNVRIVNCTVVGNRGNQGGVHLNSANASRKAVIVNTLFADNIATGVGPDSQDVSSFDKTLFSNCLFTASATIESDSFTGSGCLAGKAFFADAAARDFSPSLASPARDAGVVTPWSEDPPIDLAGNGRVRGAVDIGCYEFCPDSTLACAYNVAGNDVAGGDVTFTAIASGDDLAGLECRWRLVDGAGNGTWTDWSSATAYTPASPAPGIYTLQLEVRNGNGDEAATDMDGASFVIVADEVFVAPASLDGHFAEAPYTTRATAATELADVIAYCGSGTKVTLLDGEHAVTRTASFACPVAIRSDSGDPARTSLYRPGRYGYGTQYRLVALLAGGSFSDLTCSNGYDEVSSDYTSCLYAFQAEVSNCVFAANVGTAAFNDNGIFRDCLFTGSKCSQEKRGVAFQQRGARAVAEDCVFTKSLPGGYWCVGTVIAEAGRLTRCAVTDNDFIGNGASGNYGAIGGIEIWGGVTLEDCLIARNRARGTTPALRCNISTASSVVFLRNCTIADNSATTAPVTTMPLTGSAFSVYATNCVFHGNSTDASASAKAFSLASSAKLYLSHCLAEDTANTTSTEACFSDNPRFRNAAGGDYTLMSKSPCVGKGAAYDFTGVTDLAGNPRLFGPAVDIGCYELPRGLGSVLQLR